MRNFAPLRWSARWLAGAAVIAATLGSMGLLRAAEQPQAPAVAPPVTPPTPPLPPTPPPAISAPPEGLIPQTLPPPPVYPDPSAPPPVVAPVPPPPPPPINKVPRAGSIAVGWTYTPSNNLPLSSYTNVFTPSGVDIDARFGWQVGGINRGWPAWVGFMAGFFYYVGDQGISDSFGVDYGIFAKHALFPGRRVRLFLGYGLGAAQVWVKDVGGRGIGHVTRLSAGVDTLISGKVHFTFEFAYKLIMLPAFAVDGGEAANYNFQAVNLLAGLWFGR